MSEAQEGNTVKVHYTGKTSDGTVFESSSGRDPVQFTIGQGEIIDGFEQAVRGMSEGESKSVELTPDRAYGERREDLVLDVGRDRFPDDLTPEAGQRLQMQSQDGQAIPVTVTEVYDSEVRLDANHPLAGETLSFDLQLVEVS